MEIKDMINKEKELSKQCIKPIMYDDVVFENENILIKKICFWDRSFLWKDDETDLFKVLLPGGKSFNVGCIGTYALPDGTRATEIEFSYIGNFHEGLAKIAVDGKGYGFVNKDMDLVIPLKYNYASNFKNGFAVVSIWDKENNENKWIFIDKDGYEYSFKNQNNSEKCKNYKVVCDNCDGMFRVSNLDMGGFWGFMSLAFHSDYDSNAGIWGYADSNGNEIISPQYIYAFDFENGLALVCKGEWTKDKKWDNKHNSGKYWTETELWGMIDKTGKEIIPCKFDEIKYFSFSETSNYLQAHYGGWKEGKWGIINYFGEWVVEPIFEDLGYEIFNDDYFTYYNEDKWNDPDDIPMGIYSIKEQRVIFEPQFLDVDFLDDETIKVEVYDNRLKRNIDKIIDYTGEAIFDSQYTYIFEENNMYEVVIRDNSGKCLHGLIDKNGKEILPCKYDISFNGILFDQKKIIFKENDKYGVVTFDDEIIISPKDIFIQNIRNEYYKIKDGGKEYLIDEGKFGLITLNGNTILPNEYESISIENDLIIARNDSGSTLYRIFSNR